MEYAVHGSACELCKFYRSTNIEFYVGEVLMREQMADIVDVPRNEIIKRDDLMTGFNQPIAKV